MIRVDPRRDRWETDDINPQANQLQTPHAVTIRVHAASGPQAMPVVQLPESAPGGRRKHHPPKPDGRSSNTANAYIIPSKDPWRRRRRRVGPGQ